MPKATRKKKLKQADFQKRKLKVGKKLPQADNQTDVSFKSQKIALRAQKLAVTHEDTATAAGRNQRFKELLIQCKHYSPQSKKEALAQIQDLVASGGLDFALAQLGPIASDVVSLVLDESHSVRAALHAFLSAYLQWIDENAMMPFGASVIAYTTSAMSHITDAIRVDGLRQLKLLLPRYPQIMAKHAHMILPHFMDLLASHAKNRDGRSSATTAVSSELNALKGRESLLDCFHSFLRLVVAPSPKAPESVHDSPSSTLSGTIAWDKDQNLLILRRHNQVTAKLHGRSQPIPLFSESAAEKATGRVSVSGVSATQTVRTRSHALASSQDFYDLFEALSPRLVDFWIEASEAFKTQKLVWSPGVAICQLVMQTLLVILHDNLQLPPTLAKKSLDVFVKHVQPLFPFAQSCNMGDDKAIVQTNLAFTKFMLRLQQLASAAPSKQQRQSAKDAEMEEIDSGIAAAASSYIVHTLQTQASQSAHAPALDMNALGVTVDELCARRGDAQVLEVRENVCPTPLLALKAALISFQLTTKSMLQAFAAFSLLARLDVRTVIALSAYRALSTSPLTQLLAICLSGCTQRELIGAKPYRDWIGSLPRQLVQLRTWNQEFSAAIIDFLSHVFRTHGASLEAHVSQDLAPFFFGSSKKNKPPKMGPFNDLSEPIQLAAVHMLYYVSAWDEALVQGIAECATQWTSSAESVDALIDVAHARQQSPDLALPPALYGSLLATLAVGYTHAALDSAIADPSNVSAPQLMLTPAKFASAAGRQMPPRTTLENLWARRRRVVDLVATKMRWSAFVPSLLAMLASAPDTPMPVDGQAALLALLAHAADEPAAPMPPRNALAALASSTAKFRAFIESSDVDDGPMRNECISICERLALKWLDLADMEVN
ncbi:rRNA processing protein [Polyrhizophydium stewartii]|uniref:Pre-rRNA-processing protein n=1 Tax=Polyrhizophydium stewartii TaxID=2732419 RepID=A0ABR4N9R7_9FUNG